MADAVVLVCGGCKNQVEEDDNFCTSCGLKLPIFCPTCGERKLNCLYDNKIGDNAPTKTLQDFIQQKGKERVFFPGTSNPPPDRGPLNQQSKYRKRERKTVNFTVGFPTTFSPMGGLCAHTRKEEKKHYCWIDEVR